VNSLVPRYGLLGWAFPCTVLSDSSPARGPGVRVFFASAAKITLLSFLPLVGQQNCLYHLRPCQTSLNRSFRSLLGLLFHRAPRLLTATLLSPPAVFPPNERKRTFAPVHPSRLALLNGYTGRNSPLGFGLRLCKWFRGDCSCRWFFFP